MFLMTGVSANFHSYAAIRAGMVQYARTTRAGGKLYCYREQDNDRTNLN